MKGFVFTEFMNLVEEKFGLEVVDQVINRSDLESKGVFTAVGNYPHQELAKMVLELSKIINMPVPELLQFYGRHLFGVFLEKYPMLVKNYNDPLTFLENVDNQIHVEVAKLYPDAELPKFTFDRVSDTRLTLVYSSPRKLSAFAEGLIIGCLEHFKKKAKVGKRFLTDESVVEFTIDVS